MIYNSLCNKIYQKKFMNQNSQKKKKQLTKTQKEEVKHVEFSKKKKLRILKRLCLVESFKQFYSLSGFATSLTATSIHSNTPVIYYSLMLTHYVNTLSCRQESPKSYCAYLIKNHLLQSSHFLKVLQYLYQTLHNFVSQKYTAVRMHAKDFVNFFHRQENHFFSFFHLALTT